MSRRSSSAPPPPPPGLPDVPDRDAGGRPVRLVLLGRAGCHLCDVARDVVARVAEERDLGWVERDVTESDEALDRYAELVPVLFLDGVEQARYRVDPDRLAAALRPRRWWSR